MIALILMALMYIPLAILSMGRSSFFQIYTEALSKPQILIVAGIFALLLGLYAALLFRKLPIPSLKKSLCILLPLVSFLALTPPFLSHDIAGGYLVPAKNFWLTGANPYQVALNSVVQNPWLHSLPNIWWLPFPSVYGPLFQILTILLLPILGQNLLRAVILYKVFQALIFLATIPLFQRIVKKLSLPNSLVVLYAFNPALLVNGILEGHNDVLVMACTLLLIYFFLENKWAQSALWLGAAAAIKYIPFIFLPIFWVKKNLSLKQKILASVLVFIPLLLALTPFGFPLIDMVKQVFQQGQLGCFQRCTPIVAASKSLFGSYSMILKLVIGGILYGWICLRFLSSTTPNPSLERRGGSSENTIAFLFWSMLIVLFVLLAWVTPWYFVMVIPLGLLLSRRSMYLTLTFLLTCYALLHYVGI